MDEGRDRHTWVPRLRSSEGRTLVDHPDKDESFQGHIISVYMEGHK